MMPCKHREERPLVSRSCAIVGGIVGVGLSAVAVTWVLVANRDVSLFPFAVDRNLSAAALMGLCMLAPVFVFLKYPARIFTSGMIAWLILTGTYFDNDHSLPGSGSAVRHLPPLYAWRPGVCPGCRIRLGVDQHPHGQSPSSPRPPAICRSKVTIPEASERFFITWVSFTRFFVTRFFLTRRPGLRA